MRTFAPLVFLCVVTATSSSAAQAPQDRTGPIAQLLANAEVVAELEIVEISSRWRDGLIVTTVGLRPQRCLRGRCESDRLSIEIIGGELDGVVQIISGAAPPRLGEILLLVTAGSTATSEPRRALFSTTARSDGGLTLGHRLVMAPVR